MEKTTVTQPGKLIVIGGSAGSLDVLLYIIPRLKKDFPYPIVIVVHRRNANDTVLSNLLATKTDLVVKEIEEKESLCAGTIYTAPGDYHTLLEEDLSFSLDYSERVNFSRPSIDVVFRSMADILGDKLVCILLSGANADGTDGMIYVQKTGGITIAQKPSSAEVYYMPDHAIASHAVQHILNPQEIADFLNHL
jgi:two-component system chemotaxis response regulator CheB